MKRAGDVFYAGGVAGRLDEACLRRALRELGHSQADIEAAIERAKQTHAVVVVTAPRREPTP